MKLIFGAVLLLLIYFTGCNDSTSGIDQDTYLVDTTWELVGFEYAGGSNGLVKVPDDQVYTIYFKNGASITGQSDCNNFGAIVEIDEGSIIVVEMVSTDAFCSSGSFDGEYVDAVAAASSFRIRNDELRIYYDGGLDALVFEPLLPAGPTK